jgi:hypothetical protein
MKLTNEQEHELIDFIIEDHGSGLNLEDFTDRCFLMFEDIPGFECLDDQDSQPLIKRLWNLYIMATTTNEAKTPATATTPKQPIPSNIKLYNEAIAKGKEILASGTSKAEAARAIYDMLQNEDRDVIIQSFIDGAGVTVKGSPTYFYNVRRQHERKQREAERVSAPKSKKKTAADSGT